MSTKSEPILITGATGQRGGALALALLKQGYSVRAMTRHPDKAEELRSRGAEIVDADLQDRQSLDHALRGIKRAFLVTTPYEDGVDAEVVQGVTFADAAKAANVTHLVYSSVGSAHRKTGIPHFESKLKVEQHIKKLGLPVTIIRPVFFMENFGAPWMIRDGVLSTPLPPDCKLQMIAVDNIGAFGVAAFDRPNDFLGQELELAGDNLTFPQALDTLTAVTGRPYTYAQMPKDKAETVFGHDFTLMFDWFVRVGYNADISGLEDKWGIKLTRFKDWAKHSPVVDLLHEAAIK
jgi:uncharacterized protein YbjT (DUF2867 family)